MVVSRLFEFGRIRAFGLQVCPPRVSPVRIRKAGEKEDLYMVQQPMGSCRRGATWKHTGSRGRKPFFAGSRPEMVRGPGFTGRGCRRESIKVNHRRKAAARRTAAGICPAPAVRIAASGTRSVVFGDFIVCLCIYFRFEFSGPDGTCGNNFVPRGLPLYAVFFDSFLLDVVVNLFRLCTVLSVLNL